MEEKTVKFKSYAFAIRIIRAYKFLSSEQREFVLSKQMLRSGTAIGALIREAEHAESKADFIHKFSIALKEANETEYWLMLLHDTDYMDDKSFTSIIADCQELIKMLISIIKSSKQNK
ncbi:MAG: four helix bundle protein [Bacteroidales bacterium]